MHETNNPRNAGHSFASTSQQPRSSVTLYSSPSPLAPFCPSSAFHIHPAFGSGETPKLTHSCSSNQRNRGPLSKSASPVQYLGSVMVCVRRTLVFCLYLRVCNGYSYAVQ
ncbi:hypothetical protein BC835DRAFT_810102 [Cytidiella melzeri]|nr:hypothetical protein BC835DRAFT_810102 [Cytidiella melzeri]